MPRLTEQEQQEIIRFLEADKPLPEKYRFLLFDDKREVELVWNGKTNEVCNVVLPFQVIEQVDEPRAENDSENTERGSSDQGLLFSLDERGRQLKGWTNKLIWGDNKLILSSLKNGPLREQIEAQGGIKLIYIDPPFDVGADFSMDIEVGDRGDTFTKKPNILEEIAYRDTWGKGTDSFIAMIYERLILMRDLLAEDGSVYVHCDWRVAGPIRLVLDEVFGTKHFVNEIAREKTNPKNYTKRGFGNIHDTIYFYTRGPSATWNKPLAPRDNEKIENDFPHVEESTERRYKTAPLHAPGIRHGETGEAWRGLMPPAGNHWRYVHATLDSLDSSDSIEWSSTGNPREKIYADQSDGVFIQDIWLGMKDPKADYPTAKSPKILERIVAASSNPGDIVADFFVGSGTTAAVAEKLGRKWIVSDLGKFAIHTTRKRMIGVQRELKKEGKDYRAFEILNLGKYERQHYIGINPNLREEVRQKQVAEKEAAFVQLILNAYRAECVDGFSSFHGKRAGRLVAVGPVNLPITRLFVEEVILECRRKHITKVDMLGFEFEMGLFPNVLDEARSKGIDIAPKYIPAEVFDKRAVEKNQVIFHDVAFIEIKPHIRAASKTKNSLPSLAVELTSFSVFYSQDSIANAEEALKKKGSRIVVEKGQIVKVSKDASGIVHRETLTTDWNDWIDYWAVDFDFENKREIIRVKKELSTDEQAVLDGMEEEQRKLAMWEERWTGDFIFENEWQSFRTRKNRTLEFTSTFHECKPGRRKVAVKVVDIFGNDTMTIIGINVPKNGKPGGVK